MVFNLLSNFFGSSSTAASSTTGTTSSSGSSASMIIMLVLMVAVMYFIMIRPQKKKQQEEQKLRDSIQIGDEITTIGGISGRIVTVKEDSIVIETGADRTKVKFMRWAIQTNDTANARLAEEKAALEAAKQAEKEEKKAGKRKSKNEASASDETKKDAE